MPSFHACFTIYHIDGDFSKATFDKIRQLDAGVKAFLDSKRAMFTLSNAFYMDAKSPADIVTLLERAFFSVGEKMELDGKYFYDYDVCEIVVGNRCISKREIEINPYLK